MFDRLRRAFAPKSSPADVFAGLRAMALSRTAADFGLASVPDDAPVFSVLMEMGFPTATVTILSGADGTASLYTSTGGGVIGGQGHAAVRAAATAFVAATNRARVALAPTSESPVPANGEARFYALTPDGLLVGVAPIDGLAAGRGPLAPLFAAGQDVVTQLRVVSGG